MVYILMVLFFCFYNFPSTPMNLGKYFLGIRMDKYAHFIMFLPYPFISWLTCKYATKKKLRKPHAIIITLSCGAILAATTELCQNWIFEARNGDIMDFLADCAGILCGIIIILAARFKW